MIITFEHKRNIIFVLLAISIVIAVFSPALSYENNFFDDAAYFHSNKLVSNPGWESAKKFVTEILSPSTVAGYYQPITMISFMLDFKLGARSWKTDIIRYHNMILHLFNMLLLMLLLFVLFKNPLSAIFCGFIFGIHPTAVESMAWISERKTLLATFFALISIILYLKHVYTNKKLLLFLSEIAFVLAILSKPVVVTLPLLLVILDFYPLNRFSLKNFLLKWRYGLWSLGLTSIMIYSQNITGSMANTSSQGISINLLLLCYKLKYYILKYLVPNALSPMNPWPESINISNPEILISVVTVSLLCLLVIALQRFLPKVTLGIVCYITLLYPALSSMNMTDNSLINFRYEYLPSIGLIISLSSIITYISIWVKEHNIGTRIILPLSIAASLFISTYATYFSRSYLAKWESNTAILENMIKLYPDFTMIQAFFAWDLFELKKYDESKAFCEKLLKTPNLEPSLQIKLFEILSNVSLAKKDYPSTLAYQKTIVPEAGRVGRICNIAEVLFLMGNEEEAQRLCLVGIETGNNVTQSSLILARIYISKGRLEEANNLIKNILINDTNNEEAYVVLGQIKFFSGDLTGAKDSASKAIDLNLKSPGAYMLLSKIHEKYGNMEKFTQYLTLSQGYDVRNMGWPEPYKKLEPLS